MAQLIWWATDDRQQQTEFSDALTPVLVATRLIHPSANFMDEFFLVGPRRLDCQNIKAFFNVVEAYEKGEKWQD